MTQPLTRVLDSTDIGAYGTHLKQLPPASRQTRFGAPVSDYTIDQLILSMVYHPTQHRLWRAERDGVPVGWGHMSDCGDGVWELALSVDAEYQRTGVGDAIIKTLLQWSKLHGVAEVIMHCVEDNRTVQHLADRHGLRTVSRGDGERTAAMSVPSATPLEVISHRIDDQLQTLRELSSVQRRLIDNLMGIHRE